jgi:hypothetical protein
MYASVFLKGSNIGEAVVQGNVGDCYYLAGIASIAEVPSRIEKILATPNANKAGIYGLNVWVRSIPTLIFVDDMLPTL